MIGLKVKGEYLDLPPNAATQTERNSPLMIGDEILGEFNYPINLPATEGNMRRLGFITELGAAKAGKIMLDAEYEEYNMLLYKGTLVAEYVESDLNIPEQGVISAYFLTAISSFYSMARNVMLQHLELGGLRTIYGFQQHVKNTWNGSSDTFDYVFAPIKNNFFSPADEEPGPQDLDKFMNPIWDLGLGIELNQIAGENRVMPFIYYKYLLVQCFEHFGYTVTGDFLADPDFRRAYCPNFNAIKWVEWQFNPLPAPIDPVGIDLRRHVPRDYPVTKFLLNLANNFGIAYRINTTARRCEIVRLNSFTDAAPRKDMTGAADPRIKITFRKDPPVYALKLNFDPADSKVSKPDLKGLSYYGEVNTVDDLPAATQALDNYYAQLKYTNWLYVCKYDEELQTYMWNYLADNIYDYEPEGNNKSIESAITPVCQSLARWREEPNDTFHYALMPEVRQNGNWPGKTGDFANWEMRILFFHGLRPDNTGKLYPFSSSHNYTYQGTKVAEYSLAYNPSDGIVARFWAQWLKLLSGLEEVEMLLYLNLKEFRALDWTDVILIRNTPLLLTQMTPQSPYDDRCPCKAIKLDFSPVPASSTPCIATVGNIMVLDNHDGSITVSFTQAAPGASSWQVSLDGGTPFLKTETAFILYGISTGLHQITITPMCGDTPRPEGAATELFEIAEWEVAITLSAQLTTGRGSNNKLQLTITLNHMNTIPINFKFGQCFINTSSGIQYCMGYPGSPNPAAYTPVTLQYTTQIVVESTAYTAGADFGSITRIVLFDISGIDPSKISKAAGQSWELVLQ